MVALALKPRFEHPIPKVLIWLNEHAVYERAVAEAGLGSEVEIVACRADTTPPADVLAEAEGLIAWSLSSEMLNAMPRLRWIQTLTGGVDDWLGVHDLSHVALTCARGVHRVQMPENIVAALFDVTKPMAQAHEQQRERRWARLVSEPLSGKTVGIVGLGAIGAEVARKAAALDMRVLGVRRSPGPMPGIERVVGLADLDTILPELDFLILVLPLTEETRDLIDARRLALMKPTAWLINFARGEHIVDADLIRATERGTIAGAVLDAFRVEPLPTHDPLWGARNVRILPHMGGGHPNRSAIVAELFVDNLGRFARGEPLRELVDQARGY